MLLPSLFDQDFTGTMFDDFFQMPFGFRTVDVSGGSMNADVKEFDDKYELELELPGFRKEDLRAELKDGYLTVKAEHKSSTEKKEDHGRYIRRERYYGTCRRSFYVGEDITEEQIRASFENGILKLDIPKPQRKEEKKVEEKHYIAIEG